MVHRLKTRLSSLFGRSRYERELANELQFHIDMLTEQNVREADEPGRRPPCRAS